MAIFYFYFEGFTSIPTALTANDRNQLPIPSNFDDVLGRRQKKERKKRKMDYYGHDSNKNEK